jgi:catechol 2,3-dioxygenase-like lactoylglutathione lyase family enzyme
VEVQVTGLDHIYVTVTDLARSQQFYDRVMAVLGFRKVARPLAGGDPHIHYFNRIFQFTLRPSRSSDPRRHDPYSPGLHHFCMRVEDRATVDAAFQELRRRGIDASEPRLYPEYHDDYYATFLVDPDGLRLEVVNHLGLRKATVEHWDGLPRIEEQAVQ